jgi:hypothetical protein
VAGCENYANTASELGVCNACARGDTPQTTLRVKERELEEARRKREEEAREQWERDAMAWVAPITRERRNSKPILPVQNNNSTVSVAQDNTSNTVTSPETPEEAARREKELKRRQKLREQSEPLLEPEIVVETLCAKEAADGLLLAGEEGTGESKLSLEARREGHRKAVSDLPVHTQATNNNNTNEQEEGEEDDATGEVYTWIADGSRASETAFSPLIDCSFLRLSEARHARLLKHVTDSASTTSSTDEREATSAKLYGSTCARCGGKMQLVSRAFKTYAFLIDEDVFVCLDAKCGLRRKYVRVVDVLK